MEVVILIVLGGLGWLASLGVEKMLQRRLRPFEPQNTYVIPGYFRQPLLMVAVVLIPLEIILPLAWLLRPVNGIGIHIGLLLPALMLPLLAFSISMVWIHYGAVVLDGQRIRRLYLVGQREMLCQDITGLAQKMFFLTPVTVVRGGGDRLRFPRSIRGHPELYQRLSDLIQGGQVSPGAARSADGAAPGFPYAFGIHPKRMLWEKIAFALLMLIFAVLATLGLWIQLAQEMLPPFTWESLFLILLFLIPFGVLFPILLVIVYRQVTDPDTPVQFVLEQDWIDVIYPGQRRDSFAVDTLESVQLIPVQYRVKSEFDGAVVSDRVTRYEFQIRFTGSQCITLTPNRMAMFRQTPEKLRAVFRALYGL